MKENRDKAEGRPVEGKQREGRVEAERRQGEGRAASERERLP